MQEGGSVDKARGNTLSPESSGLAGEAAARQRHAEEGANVVRQSGLLSLVVCAVAIAATPTARASWAPPAYVAAIDVGGNGKHGTFVALEGVSFSDCIVPETAFLDADQNPNYKDLLTLLISAKALHVQVAINYLGCSQEGYALVVEVNWP